MGIGDWEKEFNEDGQIIFKGEYLNRKRNIKGKQYYGGKDIKYL